MKEGAISKASELTFQNDIIQQLVNNGWLLGNGEGYNRELALYAEDVLSFVKGTQGAQWQKESVVKWSSLTFYIYLSFNILSIVGPDPFRVFDIAEVMADDVTHHQPTGNVRLIGYCQDGLLTVEVANALRAKGRTIDFVGLYDVVFNDNSVLTVSQRFGVMTDLGWKYFADKGLNLLRRLAAKVKPMITSNLNTAVAPTDEIVLLDRQFYARYLAEACAGIPDCYDGAIDFFLSREFRSKDMSGTRSIAKQGLKVHQIKTAHHDTFASRHIKETTALLSTLVLARAEEPYSNKNPTNQTAVNKVF